jgi:hypothetical protein
MPQTSPALFDFIGFPSSHKRTLGALLAWLAQKKERFSFFVILSFLAHVALFSFIVVFGPSHPAPSSPAMSQARHFEAFRKALRTFAERRVDTDRLAGILARATDQDIYDAFTNTPKLDDRLNPQERDAVYKMMVSAALADFKERTGDRSALDVPLSEYFKDLRELPRVDPSEDFSIVPAGGSSTEPPRLYKLSKAKSRELQTLTVVSGWARNRSGAVAVQDRDGRVSYVSREYFYRDSPYQQILAMGAKLFYIVRGFPELTPAVTQTKAGPVNKGLSPQPQAEMAAPPETAPSFQVVFMPRRRPRESTAVREAIRQPLPLTPEDIGRILDDLMAYSDEEQVRRFNSDYLQRYDPDSPGLADLTREFIYRNLGMVFILSDPLSRGFDILEEVYYDNISQNELAAFGIEHRRSKAGAEILFALAASYEFEKRAIIALDESMDAARSVLGGLDYRLSVYNRSAKSYVLREVYRELAAELHRRGFASLESVLQEYRDEQIRIYDWLVRMGGALESRALYALGSLYWDEGQMDLALESWKAIAPSYSTKPLRQVRNIIANGVASDYKISRINDILTSEAAADKSRLLDRIESFHKWKKRSSRVVGH